MNDRRVQIGKKAFYVMAVAELTGIELDKYMSEVVEECSSGQVAL